MVGTKKITWNAATRIAVNTSQGVLTVIDTTHVKVGMVAQWKGTRDRLGSTVLATQLEVN